VSDEPAANLLLGGIGRWFEILELLARLLSGHAYLLKECDHGPPIKRSYLAGRVRQVELTDRADAGETGTDAASSAWSGQRTRRDGRITTGS
jgi:hypothetical protein